MIDYLGELKNILEQTSNWRFNIKTMDASIHSGLYYFFAINKLILLILHLV